MSARITFSIVPKGKSWEVQKNSTPLKSYKLKEKALAFAKNLAQKYISSRVLVYRIDGSIIKNVS